MSELAAFVAGEPPFLITLVLYFLLPSTQNCVLGKGEISMRRTSNVSFKEALTGGVMGGCHAQSTIHSNTTLMGDSSE